MKKLCSLFIGLLLFSYSTPGAYAGLAISTDPISDHYVQPILERVNKGLDNLPGGAANNYYQIFYNWLSRLSTIFLELVDTELRVVEQQRDLYKITPCLHWDLILLEEIIEELRGEARLAFKERRIFDIVRIQSMVQFVNERYRHLTLGGRDIHYEDPYYSWYYMFDTDTWCCPLEIASGPAVCTIEDRITCKENDGGITFATAEQCGTYPGCEAAEPEDTPPKARTCPFHSDYLPPTTAGYGCDLGVIENLDFSSHPSLEAERNALEKFLNVRDAFFDNIEFIGAMTNSINEGIGRDAINLDNFLAALSRTHRTREGCSITDTEIDYDPPDDEFDDPPEWPEGAAQWELRGPFFLTSDEFYLVRGLYDVLQQWGHRRDQAEYLTLPTEYPPGSSERTEAEEKEAGLDIFMQLMRGYFRSRFSTWNIEQASREAKPIVQAGDTQAQISVLTEPLRDTMKTFYKRVSKKDEGMRKFAANYGAFLRRTCVFRPCNKLLDRMLKITFEDQCFPYVSGDYFDSQTQHTTCTSAAGVEEDL